MRLFNRQFNGSLTSLALARVSERKAREPKSFGLVEGVPADDAPKLDVLP